MIAAPCGFPAAEDANDSFVRRNTPTKFKNSAQPRALQEIGSPGRALAATLRAQCESSPSITEPNASASR
jgi:hypothetical protein